MLRKLCDMTIPEAQALCDYVFNTLDMKVVALSKHSVHKDSVSLTVYTPDLDIVVDVESSALHYYEDDIELHLPSWDHCGLSPSNFSLRDEDITKYEKFLYANNYLHIEHVDGNELLQKTTTCPMCLSVVIMHKVIKDSKYVGECCDRLFTTKGAEGDTVTMYTHA